MIDLFPRFQRMMCETKTKIIIMLTKLIESGTVKACNYLPEVESPIHIDDISVELISEEQPSVYYIVKKIKLRWVIVLSLSLFFFS